MLFLLCMFLACTAQVCASSMAGKDPTFDESALVCAFEDGASMLLVKVLAVNHQCGNALCTYSVRIVEAFVMGDLEVGDRRSCVNLWCSLAYKEKLKPGAVYVVFAERATPNRVYWAHRDHFTECNRADVDRIVALRDRARCVYRSTLIHRFRNPASRPESELPLLDESLIGACIQFRTSMAQRPEAAQVICDSDIGSRRGWLSELGDPDSVFVPPKIRLSRDQLVFLLGTPTLRKGRRYQWLCEALPNIQVAGATVTVLCADFDVDERVARLKRTAEPNCEWTQDPPSSFLARPGRDSVRNSPEQVVGLSAQLQLAEDKDDIGRHLRAAITLENTSSDQLAFLCPPTPRIELTTADGKQVANVEVPLRGNASGMPFAVIPREGMLTLPLSSVRIRLSGLGTSTFSVGDSQYRLATGTYRLRPMMTLEIMREPDGTTIRNTISLPDQVIAIEGNDAWGSEHGECPD